MKISDFLLPGEASAISADDLSHAVNLPERAVRREILLARERGELICSSERGYFLAETEEEIRNFVRTRNAAIRSTQLSLRAFCSALKRMGR